jgi:hypothetical protein
MADAPPSLSEAIQVIVGDQLSSVTFVMDYWQLSFDGHVLTVLTWLSVTRDGNSVRSGDEVFRNWLCEQITKLVKHASFVDNIVTITFEDGSTIRAFARDEDYRHPCPEALLFQSYKFGTALYVT